MTSARARVADLIRRVPPPVWPLVAIVAVVLVGNGMFVLRLANNDPISWTAGISHQLCRITCGRPMIDPNVGFVTVSEGHLAAMDLLHGHWPWWNYFEGLGQPLLGEMQSAAFFPLTLLFALNSGLLWFHVVLEVIAGVSTYYLARRLSVPMLAATGVAMVFALNGTYAWLGNAVLNPVAFLPMLLLGIEMILDSTSSATQRGWYVAAIALALSIYSGFPEVAYLDGLFCLAWAVVRVFSLTPARRPRALRRLATGGVVGVVLSLPVLVPFEDFLKVAYIGSHTAAVDGVSRLPGYTFSMFFDPYVYGTIFSNPNVANAWAGIGGYLTTTTLVLAFVGLFGARRRPLRVLLALWSVLGLAGALDFARTRDLWNLIPLVSSSSFPRYIMPSVEIAVVVLAALGFADLIAQARSRRLLLTGTVATTLLIAYCALAARSHNAGVVLTHKDAVIQVGLDLLPFIALAMVLVVSFLALSSRWRVVPWLLAVIMAGEAVVLFFVPTAESPKQITIDTAPIAYLQAHQGEGRFLDLAVLYPNWGSYFSLYELSAIDLPFPMAFKNYIQDRLYPGLTPGNQFTVKGGMTGIVALEDQVVKHFKNYEAAGVKYLLMNTRVPIDPRLTRLGVRKVFSDSVGLATIYALPHPRPFFSTSDPSCTVSSTNPDQASVHCATATTLTRLELSMKGWSATVNGTATPLTTLDGVYQQVAVPAGTSTVTYRFLPPHEHLALLAGLLGVLFLVGSVVNERRRFVPRWPGRGTHALLE